VHFRLLGVPVRLHLSFFLVGAILGASRLSQPAQLLEWLAVVLVSVLLHEMGHALAARGFGLQPAIELHSMGGLTSYRPPPVFPKLRRIAISVAGPGAGLLLGLAAVAAGRAGLPLSPFAELTRQDLVWVNVGWGLLNLVPVLPLDGGNIFAALVGERPTRIVSVVVCAGLALPSFLLGMTWAGLLFAWFALANVRELVAVAQREKDRELWPRLEEAQSAMEMGDTARARELARDVLAKARSAEARASAAALVAWGAIAASDGDEATRALSLFPASHPPSSYLYGSALLAAGRAKEAADALWAAFRACPDAGVACQLVAALEVSKRADEIPGLLVGAGHDMLDLEVFTLATAALFDAGRFEDAARAGELGFDKTRDPDLAYNIACSLARAGKPGDALGWLGKAVEAGYRDGAHLDGDADLAKVRELGGFGDIRAKLGTPGA
jgi:Zn-dependent protease